MVVVYFYWVCMYLMSLLTTTSNGTAASPPVHSLPEEMTDLATSFFMFITESNLQNKRLKFVISSGDEWTGLTPVPDGVGHGTAVTYVY